VTDLSQARGQLVTFLGNAVDATDTLLARLGDAGVPDVKNGDKIARLFEKGFTGVRDIFATAQDDARSLNTSDPSQFQASATDIEKALTQGGDRLGKTFDTAKRKYKTPALNRAFKADPSCSALRS
jgi:hypothetical protein